jgi:hypothetical protein
LSKLPEHAPTKTHKKVLRPTKATISLLRIRRTTARTRATTPHDLAARSPSCTGQTARRPRPPHQHPGPPPRPKSQTAPPRTTRPSRQPRHTRNPRPSPKPCKQLLRLMRQLPIMYPEAAASTHNQHPGPLPRHPLTSTHEKLHTTAKADSPRRRPHEGCDVDAVVARSG